MNPIPAEIWNRGLSYAQYRETVTQNQETFDEVYGNPAYTPDDLEYLRGLPALKVLAIAEDWCTDVYHTLPTWARLVEELPDWSLRIFPRDSEEEVMDHFLWRNEARRIPVYAFYDHRNSLKVWWSGRSESAQEAIDGFLQGRTFAELDEEGKAGARKVLGDGYRQRFRRANFDEILSLLEAFFHRSRGWCDK